VTGEIVALAVYGFGRLGSAAVELALTRPWIDVRAVIACRPERDGERVAASVPDAPAGLRVRIDAESALREAAPEVVIVATRSRLQDVLPQLRAAAASGARAIVCSAEELACVRRPDGPEAAAIHALAREHGTSIVATGVNPGFVLDLWPLVISGLAWDVRQLRARRVVDVSVFAPHVRTNLGVGYTSSGFEDGLRDGRILGHLGFPESLRILAEAMGRPTGDIEIGTEPILADRRYELADGEVPAGRSIGAIQRATARIAGRPWIEVEMLLHAAPEAAGIRTLDEVHLLGRHELRVTIDPGCSAVLSAAAGLVNVIPRALAAGPGVFGPGDLPPAAPWLAATAPDRQAGSAPTRVQEGSLYA
jgi:2,4-diaminopentanoate dehydrogenase